MVEAVLSYIIKAVDEASSVMDKVKASMGILGTSLGELGGGFESVGSIMTGFAGAGVVGAVSAGIGEVIQGLKWSVGQAAEAEQAIKNLSVAVEKSGTSWDAVKGKTDEFLSQMQRVTVYSDEQLAGALQRLLTFGMSYDEAMKALSSTVDLAAAKQMDLESAAGIVGKTFMGNTAILARYGIDVTTSKEATAALKEAVDQVAGALKSAGADALAPFADVLGEASVTLTTSEGKMRSAKDVASDLVGAFQSGAIDGEKFAQMMDALGVSIDASKLKAADFPAVMSALNEQFGGTAQEQAKTYAGIQERFKNAVSDLGEKVGGILLPALSGITEAMIPVADWFGKGVDAVQAWITEVGKMPEIKGFVDAAGSALEGFWKYLEDVGKFIQDTFGPVLQELWGAFKELWDALSPIGEAFSEILGIFGEGTEGIDLLKAAVMAIAFEIKGFAEIIKAIAPYVREFAEAFKAAVDFIAPILGQIKDAIVGFLDALKNAFQGFYDWLVGGSLWMDMWNQLLAVAGELISRLLGDLGSKLFAPMKAAFTGALQTVQDFWEGGWKAVQTAFTTISEGITAGIMGFIDSAKITVTAGVDNIRTNWETGWNAVQTTFTTVTSRVQTELNTRFDEMKEFVRANLGEYAPIAENALTLMQGTMSFWQAIIKGDWKSALDIMKSNLDLFWSTVQAATDAAFSALQAAFSSSMGTIQGILNGAISAMQSAWGAFSSWLSSSIAAAQSAVQSAAASVSSTLSGIQSAVQSAAQAASSTISNVAKGIVETTKPATDQFTKLFNQAAAGVVSAGKQLYDMLTGHSIWPDMLNEMQSQTEAALGNIVGDFEGAFGKIGLSVPEFGGYEAPAAPGLAESWQTSVTVPVQVQIDGATVTRTIERRLIASRRARGGY